MKKDDDMVEVISYMDKREQETSIFIGAPLDLDDLKAIRTTNPICSFCGKKGIGVIFGLPLDKGGLFCPHLRE